MPSEGPFRLRRGDLEAVALVRYIPKSRGARHHADTVSKALFLAKVMPEYAATWARDWAGLFVDLVPSGVEVVTCPPRSRRRVARHYFAGLLAEALAERLGLPLVTLRWAVSGRESSHHIATQKGKARSRSRRAEVCDPEVVAGRRVLLTDDIATTGLTLETCAAALTEAGAASVKCVVLAMTERTEHDKARRDALRDRAALRREAVGARATARAGRQGGEVSVGRNRGGGLGGPQGLQASPGPIRPGCGPGLHSLYHTDTESRMGICRRGQP